MIKRSVLMVGHRSGRYSVFVKRVYGLHRLESAGIKIENLHEHPNGEGFSFVATLDSDQRAIASRYGYITPLD